METYLTRTSETQSALEVFVGIEGPVSPLGYILKLPILNAEATSV
jgi:hypothetical protein